MKIYCPFFKIKTNNLNDLANVLFDMQNKHLIFQKIYLPLMLNDFLFSLYILNKVYKTGRISEDQFKKMIFDDRELFDILWSEKLNCFILANNLNLYKIIFISWYATNSSYPNIIALEGMSEEENNYSFRKTGIIFELFVSMDLNLKNIVHSLKQNKDISDIYFMYLSNYFKIEEKLDMPMLMNEAQNNFNNFELDELISQ